jgi:hypothetical protein
MNGRKEYMDGRKQERKQMNGREQMNGWNEGKE